EGTVEWPDGNHYPDFPNVGEGYQGDGYLDAVASLGLCYQVGGLVGDKRTADFGKKGVEVLHKISEPEGPHAPNPLRDSGYGVRNYGVALALGYDWLADALDEAERKRVAAAWARWVEAFD